MHFRCLQRSETDAIVDLWNAALGPPFAIDAAVWLHCTWRAAGFVGDDATVVWDGGCPIGLVVTKIWRQSPIRGLDSTTGFVSALAVHPSVRRQGIGSRLLAWAGDRLRGKGVRRLLLGRDMNALLCGVPEATGALPFFLARGYHETGRVWDVQRDLQAYAPHPAALAVRARLGKRVDIRPATHADTPHLLTFLEHEFPGRWHYDIGVFLSSGGAPDDLMLLLFDGAVQGFAHLHSPFTRHLAYGTNWRRALTPPAGGLGPIGVGDAVRGEGLGLALLDAGLQVLAERGTRGCVIDWTTLIDFYGKVGFTPWIAYDQAEQHV